MDTDDLSEEAYRAIMVEAELFNHDLTLRFGLISGKCKNEDDFIEKSLALIKEMEKYNAMKIDAIFFGNPPKMNDFYKALKTIEKNIEKVKKVPLKKRTYPYG